MFIHTYDTSDSTCSSSQGRDISVIRHTCELTHGTLHVNKHAKSTSQTVLSDYSE